MSDLPEQLRLDLTALELADLRQQVAELRAMARARDDLIAIVAEELRNHVSPIMTAAELALVAARDGENPRLPRLTTLLERMQLLAQDFIQRSTQLLDLSRIETCARQLRPSVTDLSALVLSIVQRYDVTATHMRSLVELDIEAGITGVLDRFAVEQVVESLLSNAFYFGAGEAVTVRLRVDEQSLQLEVQDRGIGMLPDQQARILGRFERVIAQHPDFRLGTGLQVAHSLVTAMGGHIAVSSRVGKGSTFTVTLPLKSGPTVHDPHHLSVSALSC